MCFFSKSKIPAFQTEYSKDAPIKQMRLWYFISICSHPEILQLTVGNYMLQYVYFQWKYSDEILFKSIPRCTHDFRQMKRARMQQLQHKHRCKEAPCHPGSGLPDICHLLYADQAVISPSPVRGTLFKFFFFYF